MAFLRYAELIIPRIPKRLTAIPSSTMISRAVTLDAMLKLSRLITKPRTVTAIPAKTMMYLLL